MAIEVEAATDQEYKNVRDAALVKINDSVATRDDEIIMQACHNMLYYHSFGMEMADVQTKLIELRNFLRDTICGYKGYVEIRPQVVAWVVKLTEYLDSIEKPEPFDDII